MFVWLSKLLQTLPLTHSVSRSLRLCFCGEKRQVDFHCHEKRFSLEMCVHYAKLRKVSTSAIPHRRWSGAQPYNRQKKQNCQTNCELSETIFKSINIDFIKFCAIDFSFCYSNGECFVWLLPLPAMNYTRMTDEKCDLFLLQLYRFELTLNGFSPLFVCVLLVLPFGSIFFRCIKLTWTLSNFNKAEDSVLLPLDA